MAKFVKKRSKKAGLPPGTLVHIGDKKVEKVKIEVIDYDESHFQEKEVKSIKECFPFKDKPTVTWINIEGLHDVEIIEKIGKHFNLHPLVLEDIVNTDQRPKMDILGDRIYIVFKMLHYRDKSNEIETEQVSLILGSNFVISFQEHEEGDDFESVRNQLKNAECRLRKMGADYLAHALIDIVVDNYFIILEKIGEEIEDIEEKLLVNPTQEILQSIHNLKRNMIFLRKSIWPLREVIGRMERTGLSLIQESTNIYLRDVYDHVAQVIDIIETFRDIISEMFDIYLSGISNKMNEVMKVLTIIATIFIPLTFMAGVYGMNFQYMPELRWHFGYPFSLLLMLAVAVTLLIFFSKKKWL